MERILAAVFVAACLAGCGGAESRQTDDLMAQETRREAVAALNSGSAQLAGAALADEDTTDAMRVYLHAVDTAAAVLPTRYVVDDRLVGLRSLKRVVEPWCKPCARRLEQKRIALLARGRR